MECCGKNSYFDYSFQGYYPPSCCKANNCNIENVYRRGCKQTFVDFWDKNSDVIKYAGLVVAAIEVSLSKNIEQKIYVMVLFKIIVIAFFTIRVCFKCVKRYYYEFIYLCGYSYDFSLKSFHGKIIFTQRRKALCNIVKPFIIVRKCRIGIPDFLLTL